jgi:P27 family predicted phage terminase small subunit
MKRGPKSTEDRMTVVPATAQRMEPPADVLTESQVELWRGIVDSLPADYFRPWDSPLLVAYCKAYSFWLQASADLETNGITIEDDKGRRLANPAHSILVTQASAMAQLAVKLRLSPSSRISPQKAGTQAAQATGKRPWEQAG